MWNVNDTMITIISSIFHFFVVMSKILVFMKFHFILTVYKVKDFKCINPFSYKMITSLTDTMFLMTDSLSNPLEYKREGQCYITAKWEAFLFFSTKKPRTEAPSESGLGPVALSSLSTLVSTLSKVYFALGFTSWNKIWQLFHTTEQHYITRQFKNQKRKA